MRQSPQDRTATTIDAYDTVANDYAVRAETRSADAEAFFRRFVAQLPTGQRVVDLGCGPGSDLRRLVEAGHASIGVDRSAGLLGLAPSGARIRADLRKLPVADGSLDAVWSQAALLHVETADLAATFAEWERALRPRGLVGFSTSLGGDEGWELVPAAAARSPKVPLGQRRWFVHHDESTVIAALQRRNWELAEVSISERHRTWLQVLAITPHVRPPLTSVAERAVDRVLGLIGDRATSRGGEPCLVAIDGRSATVGRSSLALIGRPDSSAGGLPLSRPRL